MCVELGGQMCLNLENSHFKQQFKSISLNYTLYSWVKDLDLTLPHIAALSDLGYYLTIIELLFLAAFTFSKIPLNFFFKLIFSLFSLLSILTYITCESLRVQTCPPSLLTPSLTLSIPAGLLSSMQILLKQQLNLQNQAIELLSLSGFLLFISIFISSLKHLLQSTFNSLINLFLFILNLLTLFFFLLMLLQTSHIPLPDTISTALNNLSNLSNLFKPFTSNLN